MKREEFLQTLRVNIPFSDASLIKRADELGVKVIENDVAEFLSFFLKMYPHPIRTIVEIGTGIGYSSLLFSKLLPQATIYTVDRCDFRVAEATSLFENTNIHLHYGEGLAFLQQFEGPIDLLFLDGAKAHYLRFLQACEHLIPIGGLVVADNVFARGHAYEPVAHRQKTVQVRMQAFLDYLLKHYQTTVLPISDGLSISIRI